jgi:hypothetical protein
MPLQWPATGTKCRSTPGKRLLRTRTPGAFIADAGERPDDDEIASAEHDDPFASQATDPALRLEALVARQLRASRADSELMDELDLFWPQSDEASADSDDERHGLDTDGDGGDGGDGDHVPGAPVEVMNEPPPAVDQSPASRAEITSDDMPRPRRRNPIVDAADAGTDSGEGEVGGP